MLYAMLSALYLLNPYNDKLLVPVSQIKKLHQVFLLFWIIPFNIPKRKERKKAVSSPSLKEKNAVDLTFPFSYHPIPLLALTLAFLLSCV